MPYTSVETALGISRKQAKQMRDSGWLSMLDDLNQDLIHGKNSWKT
jgi:hypothetical protein